MNQYMLLWADNAENLLRLLVFLVALVLAVAGAIGQMVAKARGQQPGQPRPPGPPEPERPPVPDALAEEIEEFLKRVSQRRQAGQLRPAVPLPPGHPAGRPPPRQPRPAEARVELEPPESRPRAEGEAEHGREGLGTAKFGPIGQELGKQIAETDKKVERHLQEKFKHQLGRLAGMTGEAARPLAAVDLEAPPERVAAVSFDSLAAVFSNPVSLRQAVLLYEIFQRPESRWS